MEKKTCSFTKNFHRNRALRDPKTNGWKPVRSGGCGVRPAVEYLDKRKEDKNNHAELYPEDDKLVGRQVIDWSETRLIDLAG